MCRIVKWNLSWQGVILSLKSGKTGAIEPIPANTGLPTWTYIELPNQILAEKSQTVAVSRSEGGNVHTTKPSVSVWLSKICQIIQ